MRGGVSPLLPGLGVMLVSLAGIVAVEVRSATLEPSPAVVEPAGRQGPPPSAPRGGAAAGDQVARQVQMMLARPLFTPTRRPVETLGDADPGLARLTGVMLTSAGKTAIFAGPADGKPIVVEEGARVGRYVVSTIDTDAVTMIGPDGQHVLHPTFDPKPPPIRPAAPGAVAPVQPPKPVPAAR